MLCYQQRSPTIAALVAWDSRIFAHCIKMCDGHILFQNFYFAILLS